MAITHLLLDIEGTTCPVSFVADVLFPYARRHLQAYLDSHAGEESVSALVDAVAVAWQADPDPEARALLDGEAARRWLAGGTSGEPCHDRAKAVVPYLQWLIDHDIKATPLKDLQGRIWQAGYADGSIVAPLYGDVPAALQRWKAEGLVLAVYSSGSVPAQQLLYGHSQVGDLRSLFSHWFDTRWGSKQEAGSYRAIAEAMQCHADQVLFISDSLSELEAAATAGMAVLFSDRDGNPGRDSGPFERIDDYSQLIVSDVAPRP
jgi:enolase-phosphatase E1